MIAPYQIVLSLAFHAYLSVEVTTTYLVVAQTQTVSGPVRFMKFGRKTIAAPLPQEHHTKMTQHLKSVRKEKQEAKSQGNLDEEDADPINFPLCENLCKRFIEDDDVRGSIWTGQKCHPNGTTCPCFTTAMINEAWAAFQDQNPGAECAIEDGTDFLAIETTMGSPPFEFSAGTFIEDDGPGRRLANGAHGRRISARRNLGSGMEIVFCEVTKEVDGTVTRPRGMQWW